MTHQGIILLSFSLPCQRPSLHRVLRVQSRPQATPCSPAPGPHAVAASTRVRLPGGSAATAPLASQLPHHQQPALHCPRGLGLLSDSVSPVLPGPRWLSWTERGPTKGPGFHPRAGRMQEAADPCLTFSLPSPLYLTDKHILG